MLDNACVRSISHILRVGGFTLMELSCVVAVLAVTAMATLAGLGHWQERDRLDIAAQALFETLAYARREAIWRGAPVVVCRDDGKSQCSTRSRACGNLGHIAGTNDWSCGYVVLAISPDGSVARPLQHRSIPFGILLEGGAKAVSFVPPNGRISGKFRHFAFSIPAQQADSRKTASYRCLYLPATGRARMENGPCRASS